MYIYQTNVKYVSKNYNFNKVSQSIIVLSAPVITFFLPSQVIAGNYLLAFKMGKMITLSAVITLLAATRHINNLSTVKTYIIQDLELDVNSWPPHKKRSLKPCIM